MTKTLVNLTTPIVITEIEQTLLTYPSYPYQKIFANPDTRQELIAYVLSRIQSFYTVCEEGEHVEGSGNFGKSFSTTQEIIDNLIHAGIHDLLNQYHDASHIPEEINPGLAASTWFG